MGSLWKEDKYNYFLFTCLVNAVYFDWKNVLVGFYYFTFKQHPVNMRTLICKQKLVKIRKICFHPLLKLTKNYFLNWLNNEPNIFGILIHCTQRVNWIYIKRLLKVWCTFNWRHNSSRKVCFSEFAN